MLQGVALRGDLTITNAAGQQRESVPSIPSFTGATARRIGKASTLSGKVGEVLELLSGHQQ